MIWCNSKALLIHESKHMNLNKTKEALHMHTLQKITKGTYILRHRRKHMHQWKKKQFVQMEAVHAKAQEKKYAQKGEVENKN